MVTSKRILVAPLNWGLGHATRCIPIIHALIAKGFTPVIASDGVALSLLLKEFPELEFVEMPSYDIHYAEKAKHFKLKMVWDSPKIIKAISAEKKLTKKLIKELDIDGIISDNRLGVVSKKVHSVFITHQLNVLTGNTTWLTSKIHQKIINKFTECWVPDAEGKPNLTGKLGHLKKSKLRIRYIGPLSRLEKRELPLLYDLMIIISGPEPQRSMLENHLLEEVKKFKGRVLFVRGKVEKEQQYSTEGQLIIYNYMNSAQLEKAFNESSLILCRSGYTTVMDLAKLEKKAFFIPTPGQYEQEYLAKRLDKQGLVPHSKQDDFKIKMLERTGSYRGLKNFDSSTDYSELFRLFKGEGEF